MLGAVQAKWTAEWLILSKHDIDVYKTFKRFCGWLKELDFRREYSLGDITGLYGIMIGESWSYELLTAGQLANLRITVDFAAPNVRTNIELATALDAFSSHS